MEITALKQILKESKIDYFILPNSDEFFSEYLPKNEKRIEFLTGFNGSNAIIIFTQKKSYFFTDGRYILQAKNQLNLEEFEIINMAEKSLIIWLEENLEENKKLAIDPKLSSLNFVRNCQKICDKNRAILTFLTKNPVDQLWKNKIYKNSCEIFSIAPKINGADSLKKRQEVIQNSSKNFNWDFLVITDPQSLCWLLNIRSHDVEYTPILLAYGILFKNGEVDLFIDETRLGKTKLKKVNFIKNDQIDLRISSLSKKYKKVQIDPASTNYWLYQLLEKNNFELNLAQDPCLLPKSCKNPAEINGAVKAHEIDGLAVTKFLFWLENSLKNNKKIDEISAAKKLLEFRKENPAFLYESFAAISGFGANGAIIHYHSNKETNHQLKINKNQLYLIDSGGQYLGKDFCGTTDITRTIAIGTPNQEMIENFTRVLKGHIALASAKFPIGTSGAQLDVLARHHLWRSGLNYDHGTGHGVGSLLSVHEGPCAISKNAHQTLKEGMILSNEPGFYKEEEYGIRIENLMLVTKFDKKFLQFDTLTKAPLDPNLIDFSMLTYLEKMWLRKYHQMILNSFEKKLYDDERKWLRNLVNKFLDR